MAPQSLTAATSPELGLMLESSTKQTRQAGDMLWPLLMLTSIFPPTLASKGGRGLSRSLFSCLRDCLLPPRVTQPM